MISRVVPPAVLLLAAALLAGCNSKKTGDAKPAGKPGEVKLGHDEGPHGGFAFDVGGHKYMGELLVKDKKIDVYLIQHSDKTKAVFTTDKQITITAIKHEGKALPDITLKAAPLDGETEKWSHFEAAAPDGVDEAHVLNGAKFTVDVGGEKLEATIKAHEHDHKK